MMMEEDEEAVMVWSGLAEDECPTQQAAAACPFVG
jgi:hypothetical protein